MAMLLQKNVYRVSQSAFFVFFAKSMGGIVADRVLQSFEATDSWLPNDVWRLKQIKIIRFFTLNIVNNYLV